jgi:hypothetical protein
MPPLPPLLLLVLVLLLLSVLVLLMALPVLAVFLAALPAGLLAAVFFVTLVFLMAPVVTVAAAAATITVFAAAATSRHVDARRGQQLLGCLQPSCLRRLFPLFLQCFDHLATRGWVQASQQQLRLCVAQEAGRGGQGRRTTL